MFAFRRSIFLLLLIVIFTSNCKTISRMTAKGGSEFVVQVETNEPNKDEIFQQAINKLQHEIDAFGVNGEVTEIADKPYQLDVKIYEPQDIERIKKLLFTNYQLELKKVVTPPSPSPLQKYPTEQTAKQQATENQEVLPYKERGADFRTFVIVEKSRLLRAKT